MKTEDTIYDNEGTQFDETQFEESKNNQQEDDNKQAPSNKSNKARVVRSVAMGGVMGILLGTTTSFVAADSVIHNDNPGKPENPTDNHNDNTEHPAWTDGNVAVATTVNDDMSFGEAFAAARAEVGSGGSFEWHGNVYSTYTAEEWNSMSTEEKEEYNNHFNWSNHSNTYNDSSDTVEAETVTEDNTVEAMTVPEENTVQAVMAESDEPEIQFLGIVHDDEIGADIAGVLVDDQQVVMVDIEGNGTVEYVAMDQNNDGQITSNEIADVSDYQINLNQFQDNSLYASNDNHEIDTFDDVTL